MRRMGGHGSDIPTGRNLPPTIHTVHSVRIRAPRRTRTFDQRCVKPPLLPLSYRCVQHPGIEPGSMSLKLIALPIHADAA